MAETAKWPASIAARFERSSSLAADVQRGVLSATNSKEPLKMADVQRPLGTHVAGSDECAEAEPEGASSAGDAPKIAHSVRFVGYDASTFADLNHFKDSPYYTMIRMPSCSSAQTVTLPRNSSATPSRRKSTRASRGCWSGCAMSCVVTVRASCSSTQTTTLHVFAASQQLLRPRDGSRRERRVVGRVVR